MPPLHSALELSRSATAASIESRAGGHSGGFTVEIESRVYGDVLVVAPVGRIDHAAAGDFERTLLPLLDPAAGARAGVVLDLARVEYISSVGLRVLMIAGKTMRTRRARIAVASLQPIVAEILAISRFDGVVEIFPTVGAALGAMSPAALAAHDGAAGQPRTP